MNCVYRLFHTRLISVGVICLVLLGCVNAADGNPRPKVRTSVVQLGREFNLKEGQVALTRASLRIKFAQVTEDSRCPQDVECVWAGNATVRLEVGLGGRNSTSLMLNTNGNPKLVREVVYHGYKVKLVSLNPYPRSTQTIAAGAYVVTLLVSKI